MINKNLEEPVFFIRILKDIKYTKIKKNDILCFSTKYHLIDKQFYIFKYKNNDYIGFYHEETKKFYVSNELILRLEEVNVIGDFKYIYKEYDL